MATLTPLVPGNAVGAGASGVPWDTAPNGALGDNSDATFGSVTTNASGNYEHLWELGDVDADLGNMDTLAIVLRYRWTTAPSNTTWPTLSARILTSDGATVLAALNSGGAFQDVATNITTTTITNSASTAFTYVNTAATKAQWNGARLDIFIQRVRSKGGDAAVQAVYEADITGTYTTGPTTVPGSFTLDGILKKTASASFSLSAILFRTQAASFTLDSVLFKTQTASFALDALLVRAVLLDEFGRTVGDGLGTSDNGVIYRRLIQDDYLGGPLGGTSVGSAVLDGPDPGVEDAFGNIPVIFSGLIHTRIEISSIADFGGFLYPAENFFVDPDSIRTPTLHLFGNDPDLILDFGLNGQIVLADALPDSWDIKVFVESDGSSHAKIWETGASEPSAWQASTSDIYDTTAFPLLQRLHIEGPQAVHFLNVYSAASDWAIYNQASLNAVIMPRFTLDAVIEGGVAGFALDAILFRTQSASFTIDAILMPSFTLDGILKKTIGGSFTLGAAIARLAGFDDFSRTVAGGWGNATSGFAWTIGSGYFGDNGESPPFVDGSIGQIGPQEFGFVQFAFPIIKSGIIQFDYRTPDSFTSPTTDVTYNWDVEGGILDIGYSVGAWRFSGSGSVNFPDTVLAQDPGTWYTIKVHAANAAGVPIYAKFWKVGDPEPSEWTITATSGAPIATPEGFYFGADATRYAAFDNFYLWTSESFHLPLIQFTLNAIRLRSVASSFSLNATIVPFFLLDAVVERIEESSFSLDAFVMGSGVFALSLDAVLFRTISDDFTLDSLVSRTETSSFSTDAIAKRTATATLSLEAVILRPEVASFTLDAIQLKTSSAGITVDALILAPRTAGFTLDSVVLSLQQATATLDAVLWKSTSATFSLDADIVEVDVHSFALEAITLAGVTSSYPLDAILLTTPSGAFALDALVRSQALRAATIDAIVLRPEVRAALFDAVLQAAQVGSFELSALIAEVRSATFTLDSMLARTELATFNTEAVLQKIVEAQLAVDAVLLASQSGSLLLDAYVAESVTKNFTLDASLVATHVRSFVAAAYLIHPPSGITAHLRADLTAETITAELSADMLTWEAT